MATREPGLRVLSWNLAMLERSDEAPRSWEVHDTEAAVRAFVLDRRPDVVLYQELPGIVPFVETHDMIRANPRSHSGNLATLVGLGLMEPAPGHVVVPGCAVLTTFDDLGLTVANVHLTPGPGPDATSARLAELASIVEASPTATLLVVGDTNTRIEEASAIGEAGLMGDKPPHPTWNSRRNKFRDDGHEHVAYYTRWFATSDLVVDEIEVWDEPIWSDGCDFHLSDHFALTLRVRRRP